MSEMQALAEAASAASHKREHGDGEEEAAAPRRRRKKANLPREERLQANRILAVESRRRKREIIDELQKSVAFFARSNAALRQKGIELERQVLLAKQRLVIAEKGLPLPPLSAQDQASLLRLFNAPAQDTEQAQAAHFAATQAMYKSKGFPPAAARQAASTFAASYSSGAPSGLFGTSVASATKMSPKSDDQAQAAYFTATQAMYKSMGFPPRAAKEAAMALSHCHQSPAFAVAPTAEPKAPTPPTTATASMPQMSSYMNSASYIEALNQFSVQQAAAAKMAASMATAAMQAAKVASAPVQSPQELPSPYGNVGPSGGVQNPTANNAALMDLIAKLSDNQGGMK